MQISYYNSFIFKLQIHLKIFAYNLHVNGDIVSLLRNTYPIFCLYLYLDYTEIEHKHKSHCKLTLEL